MNFEKLANQHKDAVYRQLIRACGNREDAEDVLIEALLKAYQHLDQLQNVVAFRSWLVQIGKRVCWQFKQKEELRPILQLSSLEDEGREVPGEAQPMESQIALKRMKEMLQQALQELPPELREVFVLRDIEEEAGDEVAKQLNISVAAMKSRLYRARTQIRKHVDHALLNPQGSIS
jgi:RNA polymerase sigma-70 factor, ECF subfamily